MQKHEKYSFTGTALFWTKTVKSAFFESICVKKLEELRRILVLRGQISLLFLVFYLLLVCSGLCRTAPFVCFSDFSGYCLALRGAGILCRLAGRIT